MPAKKQATVSPIKPTGRTTPRRGGLEEIIDFDAEVAAVDKDRKPKKFRLRGFDYTLGKGPNPYVYQLIGEQEGFDITEFLGLFIVESQRKRFTEAVRTGPYGSEDYGLLQKRLMEASVDRPIEAS